MPGRASRWCWGTLLEEHQDAYHHKLDMAVPYLTQMVVSDHVLEILCLHAVALTGVLWRKAILLYTRIAAVMRYCRLVCACGGELVCYQSLAATLGQTLEKAFSGACGRCWTSGGAMSMNNCSPNYV